MWRGRNYARENRLAIIRAVEELIRRDHSAGADWESLIERDHNHVESEEQLWPNVVGA